MNTFEENHAAVTWERDNESIFYFNLARLLTAPNNSMKFTYSTVSEI